MADKSVFTRLRRLFSTDVVYEMLEVTKLKL